MNDTTTARISPGSIFEADFMIRAIKLLLSFSVVIALPSTETRTSRCNYAQFKTSPQILRDTGIAGGLKGGQMGRIEGEDRTRSLDARTPGFGTRFENEFEAFWGVSGTNLGLLARTRLKNLGKRVSF